MQNIHNPKWLNGSAHKVTLIISTYRYVQLCRSLKTYGMTSFNVKTKDPIKKNKLKDLTIGVTRESVIFMDFETKV